MNILIADDHGLFREGLRSLLETAHANYQVECASTYSEIEAAIASRTRYRLILLDLHMPGMRGIESVKYLRESSPDSPILIVSADESPETVHQCLDTGAIGYLTKSSDVETMNEAIVCALAGRKYIPEQALKHRPALLNHRQRQILALLHEGKSNREISEQLGLSEGTVKQYVSRLLTMLDVDNRTQAGMKAKELLGLG